ncbi:MULTISPECIES: DUF6672 family protein [unclassified Treponema]|uniref:DUF6672 family protein n=1 Tax=unclassified Treponema TaxID=2638727 RepID=UPI0020A54767|nr:MULTISPECIES: DUF6672 family protein [unclassified Treponema]UTC66915.1 hypothetical protein E4O06_13365 [Treponema sp. OMZ 789]UTC69644.1 hypothetical protein E4O01_13505 [Treponema sp. OMZ 790]UTC72358.1 hypothetical protein E4O02_13595 [Treponema sp. OMZ 791]
MRIQSKKTVLAIRIILPILYVLLLALMFTFGRTHAVLFENKKAVDSSFKAFDAIEVSFNGQEPLELFKGDRDKLLLRGQKHRVVIRFTDGREDFVGEFRIPLFQDTILLSLPALVEGLPSAVTPFELYTEPAKE